MSPKVSVILSVYNGQTYLVDAVESILGQTFSDFEFLIHDDGSTDKTLEILREFEENDSRISLSSGSNQGVVLSVNGLMDRATAPLLARMDADDISLPDRFALQVAYLDSNPDCVVLGGSTLAMDAEGRLIAPNLVPTEHNEIDSRNLRGLTSIVQPTVMMRKEAVEKCGGYNLEFPNAEDQDLWLRLAEIGRINNLRSVILKYRIHDQSMSGSRQKEQAEFAEKACKDAWKRRGVEYIFEYQPWRMEETRSSRRDFFIKYAWDAWNWGYRDTWRHYAMKAVVTAPFSIAAWKLVVFGWLRRPPQSNSDQNG